MKGKALWMIAGNGGYAAFQLMIMVVISKTLGVEELGVFSLGFALSAPIMLFSNFGTRILWITDLTNNMPFRLFRNARVISSILGMIVCFAFLTLYNQDPVYLPVMLLITMSKVIENNADIYYADLHKRSNQKYICVSLITRGALGVIGVSIGCIFFNSLLLAAVLYFLFWGAAHIVTEHLLSKKTIDMGANNKLSKEQLLWLAKQGAPLAVGLFLINFNMNIPRIFLENQHGLKAIGIFSALYFFIQTGSVVINSLGQVMLPILSSLYNKNQTKKHLVITLKTFGGVFAFSFIGAIFSYFAGEYFLNILFGKDVSKYSTLMSLFFLLSPAQYLISIMSQVIASTQKNMSLMWCQLIMFLVVVALAFLLVPKYDIQGAYWATAVASSLVLFIYIFFYLKTLKLGQR